LEHDYLDLPFYLNNLNKKDAEGNFQVFFDRKILRVAFRITLHKDDEEVLHKIKRRRIY